MPFAETAASHRYARSEVNLGDVLGAPGFTSPGVLAEELGRALDSRWSQLSADDGLFLDGDAGPAGAVIGEAAGAFARAPRIARTVIEVALEPGRATGADEVVSVMDSVAGRHEVRQQLVRGAPVVGACYGLHFDGRDRVTLTGRPVRDLHLRDPGPPPRVRVDQVRRAMRAALGLPARLPIEVELVVFPVDGTGVWAYKGECVPRNPPGDLRIFLRAEDLSMMLCYDVAASALYGEAAVYPVSPSRTPQARPALLDGLGPEPPDCLAGAETVVRPVRGAAVTDAVRDYRIGPDDPGFDQVSAYYHVRAAAWWFGRHLGSSLFDGPPFRPLTVLTGDRTVREAVALFIPATGELKLNDARRNPARSADIIFHEFTHAVVDRICRLNRSAGMEAKIMSEGFADFCASSALDDPRFGDYVQDQPAGARNCADPALRFPPTFDDPLEPYVSGAVWAAVLWDIRTAVGAGIADLLVLNSLYYLGPNATLADGQAALIKTDRTLFSGRDQRGRHEDVINEKCQARRGP